jgi:hypothetical protein
MLLQYPQPTFWHKFHLNIQFLLQWPNFSFFNCLKFRKVSGIYTEIKLWRIKSCTLYWINTNFPWIQWNSDPFANQFIEPLSLVMQRRIPQLNQQQTSKQTNKHTNLFLRPIKRKVMMKE